LWQEHVYLLELVRYIHLNPIRARPVEDLNELRRYPDSGHSVLMGKKGKSPYQETQWVHYKLRSGGFHVERVVSKVSEVLGLKARVVLAKGR